MGKIKFIALTVTLLVFGCAGLQTGKKMAAFDEASRAYDRAIRWGEYEAAYAFKKISDTENKFPDFEGLGQVMVTAYKIKQTIIAESKLKILRLVDIQYYKKSDVTVKIHKDQQKWEYDEEKDRWYLTSELPDFK